ncbi:hypothetical protein ACPF7Z_09610 [Halomonas sp. GXIMD04776]|uniref:hypothetical protein n=1 Tax=Halomonas sp. GXIMD04776 TaxID=3415605 RepID=UPI003CAEC94A
MSDFLFVSKRVKQEKLSRCLNEIYQTGEVESIEFHGAWGSLAVSQSQYNGFDPLITERYICAVIGGPVLYFRDNRFLSEGSSQTGTRAIFDRWFNGEMDWSEDLSGPFVVLIIDQLSHEVLCVTDLMMFIPIYQYQDTQGVAIGTHIDALAKACGQQGQFDEVSLADFILHEVVTYPYTAYRAIRQGHPAAEHRYRIEHHARVLQAQPPMPYWMPSENNPYRDLDEAANVLKEGVTSYVGHITESMDRVAQFTSAGEDSRALSGIIPQRIERDAFIFLDHMNREGEIAGKVAAAYGANFYPSFRSSVHYISILPEASSLIGSGHQYVHAHSLGFNRKCRLADYKAVFGGYLADSLIKAQYARKPSVMRRFGFIPQVGLEGESRSDAVTSPLFSEKLLDELTQRRRNHLNRIQAFRPTSAHEWFVLWPMTMRLAIPNFYSNRRLFASFEPFMSKDAVKVGAGIPTEWKLNRRLFNKAFRPFLAKTRWLHHADGRLPYYPWYVNSPIQFATWLYRQVERRLGLQEKGHQGPWGDWLNVIKSSEWQEAVDKALHEAEGLPEIQQAIRQGALSGSDLKISQKANLLQTVYLVDSTKRSEKEREGLKY